MNRPVAPPPFQPVHSNTLACFTFGAIMVLLRISLVRSERDASDPPEKFRHKTAVLILL
jgi:hypothetical protein